MNVLFYFLHTIFCPEHNKTIIDQSFLLDHFVVAKDGLLWLNIVTSSQLICDVTRTRGTGIVTSYWSIVLHVQFGAEVIFTNE